MRNEATARMLLAVIASSESHYRQNQGKGSYASLEQLISSGMFPRDMIQNSGYRIELSVNGDKFQAVALPVEYGKTGKFSYFVDETGVVRGADHGGAAATVADIRVQ
jgi:hypothetical protein